jgi:hypothetical protein
LRVEIHHQRALTLPGETGGQIDHDSRLSAASFLIGDGDGPHLDSPSMVSGRKFCIRLGETGSFGDR